MKLLEVRVTAGDSGPVIVLSGEADLTTATELCDALNAQIAAGVKLLIVDLSRLRFADSAAIGALARAARTLKTRGGRLELVRPQPAVARTLSLLGVDQAVTIRGGAGTGPGPESA